MFTEQSATPQPLTCGGVLYLDTVVSEKPVECETFDFRSLLDRAIQVRNTRLASVQCPAGCTRKDSWVFSRVRQCRERNAFLSIRTAVVCRNTDAAPAPAGLAPPTAPLTGDGHDTKDVPGGQDWSQEVREYGPRAVVCTTPPEVVRYDAIFIDRSCPVPTFQPYVAEAEARAAEYDALLTCAAPCTRQPFSLDYVVWECARGGEDVLVKVYWTPCG
jgi:hypothetical protein